jgi:PAS domain S-box-containing protein
MKTDRKTKAEKSPPKLKAVKRSSGVQPKPNGKHPLTTYEHIPVGVVEVSLDGKYMDVNEEFCRILGYSRKELLRRGIKNCTHEDDYAIDFRLYEQLVTGKIPYYRIEKRYVRKDGETIWVELTRSLVCDAKGKPLYTMGVVLDISDRRDVERVLRDSVERLRLATGAARMFMWEWDFQTQSYTIADNFEQVLGFSAGLLPKNKFETVWALSPKEDVERISESFVTAVEHQSDLHALPCRVLNPETGQVVWLEVSAKIIYTQAGVPERMFGVAQNITESKNAQDEMAIISRMPGENPNPVMRLTPDGNVLYANPASASLVEDWIQGERSTIPEELQSAVTQAFQSGTKPEVELVNRGRTFTFTLAPIVDPGYVNLYGKDITERKQTQEKLRESEERFRALVSQTTAGITESDMEGRLTFVNPRFSEILGYPEEKLIGRTIWELTYPDDREENWRLFQQMLTLGKPYQLEKRFNLRDGSSLWTNVSVSTIRDSEDNPIGGVGVVIDIDQRKKAEEILTEYARQHEALYRLSNQLHRADTSEDIYAASLEAILSALQCDCASILLFDETNVMRFVAWRGLSDEYRKATDGHSPWTPDAKDPQPISMDDVSTADLDESLRAVVLGEGVRSLAFIPLVSHGKLIGKFMVYYNEPHTFDEEERNLSLTIAHQLAFGVDRKRAEEALARERETLERLFETMPVMVSIIDPESNTMRLNAEFERRIGWKSEDVTVLSLLESLYPDPEYRQDVLQRMAKAGKNEWVEVQLQTREGRTMDSMWSNISILENQKLVMGIAIGIDITERKQAEEALRQSEERFARFMEQLPGLAWIKDIEGRYVYANAAAERAFNTPRELLYGRRDEEIFPPDVAAQFRSNDMQALADEKGVQVIETLRQQDGVLHSSLVNKFPIPGPDGSTTLIGGTAFDITERLRAEEALQESEERFRAILRQATAGILRKDAYGRLLFVNQAFCNMLGYTESELLGKTVWDVMHPDDIEENRRSYERLMLEGTPFKLERRFLRQDGSVIWVDASVSPIMDAAGKPQSAVAVEVDITGRKHAEEALRELNMQLEDRVLSRTAKLREVNQALREEITERQRVEEALRQSEALARANEEKLSTLFELLPVGISFLDPEGQIIQVNPALTNIMKLSKEQLLNRVYQSRKYIRPNGMVMPPSELASQRALREGKTVYNVETGVVLEDGEVLWTSVSAAPVDVAEVGAVVVTADITESKRAERALRESRERLQILSQRLVEVQEEERRAIARELHDRVGQTLAALNINLIIISGQIGGKVDEQVTSRLGDSMKLVAETIALVRDVMSNLRPSVLDDYGLESAIDSHLNQFTARYEIKVKFEKPDQPLPRLGPSIEMTFLRIAQEALMNIAKHAQANQVTLSLQREGNAICMTIKDNGSGITSWQEANRPGSHGLTIMRERAEAFGGHLNVSSVPGKGTKVEVKIPVETNEQSQPQEGKSE